MSWRSRAAACALLTAHAAAGVGAQGRFTALQQTGAEGTCCGGPFRVMASAAVVTPASPVTPTRVLAPASASAIPPFATPLSGTTATFGFPPAGPLRPPSPSGPDPGTATLLSLGLPGAGQHVLGKRRKWLYLAVEAVGWTFYLERRAAGGRLRDRYRDFVWQNARLTEGPRVEGDFHYYETLTQWVRSGAFDADPQAPGLQPEPDEQTYNGAIWALARQIHLPAGAPPQEGTPGYDAALAYYEERAYGPVFLWDWSTFPGGQVELARLIGASDDRFRQATTVLGAVLANHLISAVDAYVSARGLAAASGLRVRPDDRPGAGRWNVLWSVPLG